MGSGSYFIAQLDNNSAARMNQKTVTMDTGSALAALTATYPCQVVISTDTSGGFLQDTMYQRNAANNAWVAVEKKHDHSANTDSAGGLFSDILQANVSKYVALNVMSPHAADFNNTGTGGTTTDDFASANWRVKLDTSTTANNYRQADRGTGVKLDFGSKIMWQAKLEEQAVSTDIQSRMGVQMEAANSAQVPANKCVGFEFCDSNGVNYQVSSGDGTSRSVLNTGVAFAGVHSVKFLYTPTANVVGTIDATSVTKTSNLPNSGAVDMDKTARFGILTTNTVTKTLYVYAYHVVGLDSDTGWH